MCHQTLVFFSQTLTLSQRLLCHQMSVVLSDQLLRFQTLLRHKCGCFWANCCQFPAAFAHSNLGGSFTDPSLCFQPLCATKCGYFKPKRDLSLTKPKCFLCLNMTHEEVSVYLLLTCSCSVSMVCRNIQRQHLFSLKIFGRND